MTNHRYHERSDVKFCDFCAECAPAWAWILPDDVRPQTQMLLLKEGEEPETGKISDGDGMWGACAACDRLIRQARERPGRMPALIARVARHNPAPAEFAKPFLASLYAQIVPAFVKRLAISEMEHVPETSLEANGSETMVNMVREMRDFMHERRGVQPAPPEGAE